MNVLNVLDDKRPIKSIHLASEGIFVGGEVDEITPYPEHNQFGAVAWFAIYFDGKLIRRVNGALVESVNYA